MSLYCELTVCDCIHSGWSTDKQKNTENNAAERGETGDVSLVVRLGASGETKREAEMAGVGLSPMLTTSRGRDSSSADCPTVLQTAHRQSEQPGAGGE